MFRLLLIICLAHLSASYTITGRAVLQGHNPSSATNLPTGCQVTITVADTSIADAPARVLNQVQLSAGTSFPVPFEATFTPDVPPQPSYTVMASITCGGQLRFFNDQRISITIEEDGTSSKDIPVRAFP